MSNRILILLAAACLAAPSAAMAQSAFHAARARAESACAGMGLNPSEAPFAYCVASLERSGGAAEAMPDTRPGIPQTRYYRAGDQLTSIHRACAGMGEAPGSQAYQSCVGNLNMTINDANRVGTD